MTTFSAVWSDAIPAGSLNASDLDQAIRDLRRDIHERMSALLGSDWASDPLAPVSLTVSQFLQATTYIAVGAVAAASGLLRVPNNQAAEVGRNAANSADVIMTKLNALNQLELAAGKLAVDSTTGAFFRTFTGIGTGTVGVPKTIYSSVNSGGFATVWGNDGAGKIFHDYIMWDIGTAQIFTLLGQTIAGVPGARTYTVSGSNIQLTMAAAASIVKVYPTEVV